MTTIKVFIADDQLLFMEGLQTLLSVKDSEIELVGSAKNGLEALERIAGAEPDVLLLDIQMPGIDGIETVKRIRSVNKDLKIIMLTTFHDRDLIERALKAGADGYLLKDIKAEQVIKAIHDVKDGNILISPEAVKDMMAQTGTAFHSQPTPKSKPQASELPEQLYGLSPREREVFSLLISGKDNPQIAEELFISEKTVRNHVTRIYQVLEVKNRTQVILWAINYGLL